MAIAEQLSTAALGDYISLAKPRVVLLHLITAAAAMFLAAGSGLPSAATLLFTLAGGGLMAGASNTLNCYFDCDIDGRMARTRKRPLPAGRLKPNQALAFGVITGSASLLILSSLVGWIAGMLAATALVYYVLVYTVWLKRRTYWSAVIGSGAGAVPPLVGWVAVTNRIELTPFLLFAVIWLWTPPHFWSLAIFRRHEYEAAGVGVLPTHMAARWSMVCSGLLVLATLLLVPVAGLGLLYFTIAVLLGAGFLILGSLLRLAEPSRAAKHLYAYSIIYVVLLFAAMIADRLI